MTTNQTKHPEPIRIAKAWKLCQQGWSYKTIGQLLELSPHHPKLFAIECAEKVKHIYNDSDFVKKHPEHAEAVNDAIKAAKGNNKKEQQKAAYAVDAAAYAASPAAYTAATAAYTAANAAYYAAHAAHAAHAAYHAAQADPSQKAWQLQRLMVYMLDEKPNTQRKKRKENYSEEKSH